VSAAITTYNGTNTVLYFPAGTYQWNGYTAGSNQSGFALRGAGMFQTTLVSNAGGAAFAIGAGPGFGQPAYNPTGTVASGFTRGSTSITVTSNGNGVGFRSGELLYCSIPNDPAIPVLAYSSQETGFLDHMNYVVTATNTGGGSWTLTLRQPISRDYAGTITVDQAQPGVNTSRNVGIEDMTLNCNSVVSRNGVVFDSVHNAWAKNVRVTNADNYPFSIYNSVHATITGCFAAESIGTGSSHAGIAIYSNCNGVLVEDNIVVGNFAGIIVQTSVNCAVSHNFLFKCLVTLSPNHSAFPHHNVYEGNVADNANTDGTHGGTSTSTFHRNWFMAVSNATSPLPPTTWNTSTGLPVGAVESYGFSAKRWTVKYTLLRNIFGTPGYSNPVGALNLDGQPNLGNGFSYGYGTYGGAAATLSVRTSDSAGTVTAPSGHGITTGSYTDVYWGALDAGYNKSFIRRNMLVGTVSGGTIPVSGGFGHVLPAQASAVFVPTSNTAVRTYPQDWDGTNFRPHRWAATLTAKNEWTSLVFTVTAAQSSVATAQARVSRAISEMPYAGVTTFRISGFQTAEGDILMSGSTLTLNLGLGSWFSGLTVGNTYTLDPSSAGFQELDLDVRRTTIARANRTYQGTLVLDDLQAGETTPASYIYGSAPGFLTGYAFPVFDVDSIGTLSVRRLPAGDRYMTFLDTGSFDGTTVATPQFSPAPGTHAAGTTLTITCSTTGHATYYTTNGSDPTTSSTLYSGPISLSVGTTVVKARSFKSGLTDSAIQSGTYILVNAPVAASGLNATTASTTQINVTWNDNSDNETGFRLERRIGAGSWSTVTTTAANATSYSNTGLTPATTYEYRVYALNAAGDSTASNTDSATTDSEGGGGGDANATIQTLNVGTLNIQ
jgi:parallel beta-helix repeat protein